MFFITGGKMNQDYSIETTDAFLQAYRELEKIKTDNERMFDYFESKNKKMFDVFRSIRNNLSHNTVGQSYPVIVSDEVLKEIRDIIKKMNVKAIDVAIPIKNIYYTRINSLFSKVVEIMAKNNFSYVPILNDSDIIKGIVSDKAIMDIISNNNGQVYNEETKVLDYIDYFNIINNPNECYLFMNKDSFLYEVKEKFDSRYKDKRKVGVIFLTKTGIRDEKIIAMITARNVYTNIEKNK